VEETQGLVLLLLRCTGLLDSDGAWPSSRESAEFGAAKHGEEYT
jgi:hypothetical protein